MRVEVDQSGKIEATNRDTILAFANGESRAIRIPASVKREAFQWLRTRGKRGFRATLHLFAACLSLLPRGHLLKLQEVTIDEEYIGREADLKAMLLRLLWRVNSTFPAERITFARIGKKSPAHLLALAVFQKKKPPDQVMTFRDLLHVLK
jgi:hypothetical protein